MSINILSSEEMHMLHAWLEDFRQNDLSYAVYGTGQITQSILEIIRERNLLKPTALLDHQAAADSCSGIPVISLSDANREQFDWIIIGSNTYQDEIKTRLKEQFGSLNRVLDFSHLRGIELRTRKWNENKQMEREMGVLFNISKLVGPYAVYGKSAGIKKTIETARFLNLPLPEVVLVPGSTDNQECFAGIPIASLSDFSFNRVRTVLWKGSQAFWPTARKELESVLKDTPVRIQSLHDKTVYDEYGLNFEKTIEQPFVMNRTVFLALTARCNLKCSYCLTPEQRREISKEPDMTFEQTKKILDEIQGRISLLCLAGHGETLLNKDLEKIIRYAADSGIPAVELVTNGTLLTKERARQLAQAGLHHLHVSFDSLDAAYNRKHRGIEIDEILQHTEDYSRFTGLGIVINVVLSHRNLHLISELPKLKERIPTLLGIVLIPANPLSSERSWDGEFEPIDPVAVREHIAHAREIAAIHGIGIDVPPSLNTYNSRMKTSCCHRPFHNLYIYHDGMMKICNYPCNKSDEDYQVGNVYKPGTSVLEMLNSEKYKNFRRRALLGELPEACRICRHAMSQ